MGTVTHETIGYLWPMGPWYRVFAATGIPVWVGQRLWTGTLLLLAGLGRALAALPDLGVERPGPRRGQTPPYMLSPYVLQYEARTSAILMAFSALPWMLALTVRAARSPQLAVSSEPLFALVAATARIHQRQLGMSLRRPRLRALAALRGLGAPARRPRGTPSPPSLKMLGLSVLAALWWLAALAVEAGYGLGVLALLRARRGGVAHSGLAFEALRGLGHVVFLRPRRHPPMGPTPPTTTPSGHGSSTVSFALPVLAFVAAAVIRWRHKLYFAGLVLVGVALAVGVHPYHDPSPVGSVLKALDGGAVVGSALRAAGQAVPLVALGTAALLGAGVDALWRRRTLAELEDTGQQRQTMVAVGAAGLVGVLVVLNIAPLWLGQFVDNNYQAPDHVKSDSTGRRGGQLSEAARAAAPLPPGEARRRPATPPGYWSSPAPICPPTSGAPPAIR